MGRFIVIIILAILVGMMLWGIAWIAEEGADNQRRSLAEKGRESDDVDTVLGAKYVQALNRAKSTASDAEIASIRTAFVQYYLTFNSYPETIEELIEKRFLDRNALSDPWFQEYRYELEGPQLTIVSPGPDRIRNTKDDVEQVIRLQ